MVDGPERADALPVAEQVETPPRGAPAPPPAAASPRARDLSGFGAVWLLIGAGLLGTHLGYSIADLPFKYLLKDRLALDAAAVSFFFAATQFTNYIKPLAGILTDALPIFGTRRRHYLLISLTGCGLMWFVLGIVPRRYGVL